MLQENQKAAAPTDGLANVANISYRVMLEQKVLCKHITHSNEIFCHKYYEDSEKGAPSEKWFIAKKKEKVRWELGTSRLRSVKFHWACHVVLDCRTGHWSKKREKTKNNQIEEARL